jgi:serine/threonine-protein kinase
VGYYLLTGQQVFEGDTVMQVIARHLQSVPEPPSQRVHSGVPPDLELVVLACLAKKPEERPQSAAELARMLDAAGIEPWTESQASAWWLAHGENPVGARRAVRDSEAATREVSASQTSR